MSGWDGGKTQRTETENWEKRPGEMLCGTGIEKANSMGPAGLKEMLEERGAGVCSGRGLGTDLLVRVWVKGHAEGALRLGQGAEVMVKIKTNRLLSKMD